MADAISQFFSSTKISPTNSLDELLKNFSEFLCKENYKELILRNSSNPYDMHTQLWDKIHEMIFYKSFSYGEPYKLRKVHKLGAFVFAYYEFPDSYNLITGNLLIQKLLIDNKLQFVNNFDRLCGNRYTSFALIKTVISKAGNGRESPPLPDIKEFKVLDMDDFAMANGFLICISS